MLDTKEASKPVQHLINSLFFIAGLAVFTYMMVTNISSNLNSPYVSLSSTGDDQVCQDVPAAVNGEFNVDYFGRYASQRAFNPAFELFKLVVPGVLLTEATYKTILSKFAEEFSSLGARSATRQTSWNLAAWSSTYAVDASTNIKFVPITKPARFFSAFEAVNSWPRSKAGICTDPVTLDPNAPSNTVAITATSFVSAENYIDIDGNPLTGDGATFDYSIYITRMGNYHAGGIPAYTEDYNVAYPGPCPSQFNPSTSFSYQGLGSIFGVDAGGENPYSMTFKYDSTSLLVAAAVNMGIIPISKLMSVLGKSIKDAFPDMNVKAYVHPFHADMFPILCITAGSAYKDINGASQTMPSDACFMVSGKGFSQFYPVITSINDIENACDCASTDYNCEWGAMRVSMLYSIDGTINSVFDVAATLGMKIKSDPIGGDLTQLQLIDDLYTKCKVADLTVTTPCQAAWDAVGAASASNVGMFTFFALPENQLNSFTPGPVIFEDLFQYSSQTSQVCKNTIYNAAAWTTIQSDTPVPLKQAYYSCTTTPYNAVKAEIGNSYGFVMLFVNIFLLTFLIIIYALDRDEKHHKKFRPDGEEKALTEEVKETTPELEMVKVSP